MFHVFYVYVFYVLRLHFRHRFNLPSTITPLPHRFYTAFAPLNGQNRPFTASRVHTALYTHPGYTPPYTPAYTVREREMPHRTPKRTLPPWISALFSFPVRELKNRPLKPCTGSMQ